ncbi:MAG TPA: cobamide remodeling phosphodiesterase CbiR [Armatimonadota bacterium]|nr:cobamide remodeling phosphodiesterase CbiR [Armatimonadota bacterium]
MSQREQITGLKGRFPFRLGTSSYIIPDDILPNVRFLAGRVDDIELILFESDEMSNIPDEATVAELKQLADDNGLTYTVHLPLDADLGETDDDARARSVGKCRRVIETMASVDPHAHIVHFHKPVEPLTEWADACDRSLGELCAIVDHPELLAVETLAYPYEWVDDIVRKHGASICIDVGHVLLSDYSLAEYLDRYIDRMSVMHLHGIIDGKDHASLEGLTQSQLALILQSVGGEGAETRVVTLEIFSEADLVASEAVLARDVQ